MNEKIFNYTGSSYLILYDGLAILCLVCGLISYNPNDVKEKYCGHCHIFHEVKHG